jgi:beta-galactosidase
MLRAFETVVRDRNHPSVIIWSVGNENPITAIHLAAARYVKGADPTRPTLYPWHPSPEIAANPPAFPGDWVPPEADVLAPHYPTSAQALAMTTRANRPVIATEYAHAWAENRFGDLAAVWRGLTAPPSGAGGMIWMWQDQGLRINGKMLLTPAGQDGIVNADRTPQRDYWETKAVYAPVSVPIERLEWKPGPDHLRVPVSNDYDFLDLSAVQAHWRLMADERELASGVAHVIAAPHSTGWLEIPAAKVRDAAPGAACYLHVAFRRADGSEITTRAVEILRPNAEAPQPATKVSVRKGHTVTISAGAAAYEFDPQSARLVSVTVAGKRVAHDMRLTLWRPLDSFELAGHKRVGFDGTKLPDLDQYTTKVREWKVTTDTEGAHIAAKVEHAVGERNRFDTEYRYTVRAADGALDIEYTVHPRVEAPWLPEVGMEASVDGGVDKLRWLGLGPLESAPNMRVASIFGLWNLPVGDAGGIRGDVRWAEFGGVRIENCGYLRLAGPGKLRILSAVEGRGAKFRRAERAEDRIDVNDQTTLAGRFRLRAIPR